MLLFLVWLVGGVLCLLLFVLFFVVLFKNKLIVVFDFFNIPFFDSAKINSICTNY